MTYRISKRFDFSASHQLEGLRPGHPCARVHGHNYSVEVELAASDVDRVGFVFDYLELAWVKSWLDLTFDHQHLNERMSVNPTAENIAKVVFDQCAKSLDLPLGVCVEAVRVMETPKTTAEYRP